MRELTPGQVFAGYVIQRRLGAGGMGAVFLARHPNLPRFIALKLLDSTDDDARGRFLREADHVAQLEHPNIVAVYDRGSEDDQLWISMQYIDGGDAATAVQAGRPLPVGRAVRIISEAAKALDYAHAHGVLHRDVKPANILLGRPAAGEDERVVLADFGIAKALEDTQGLTGLGMLRASFPYTAPERFQSFIAPDARADVYSLGCTFYHLLTGSLPYPGTTAEQLMNEHLSAPIPQPSQAPAARQTGVSADFDEVIALALEKDRTKRFKSCHELAAAAQRASGLAASGRPATAAPLSSSLPTTRSAQVQLNRSVPVPGPAPSLTSDGTGASLHADHLSASAIGQRRPRHVLVMVSVLAACVAVAVAVAAIRLIDGGDADKSSTVASSVAVIDAGGGSTAAASSTDPLPGGYVGAWQGTISDELGLSFDVLLTLHDGRVGDEVGTLTQTQKFGSGGSCETQVLLKSVSSTEVTFQERLPGGQSGCIDTGDITTLRLLPEGTLQFSMASILEITGTLQRR